MESSIVLGCDHVHRRSANLAQQTSILSGPISRDHRQLSERRHAYGARGACHARVLAESQELSSRSTGDATARKLLISHCVVRVGCTLSVEHRVGSAGLYGGSECRTSPGCISTLDQKDLCSRTVVEGTSQTAHSLASGCGEPHGVQVRMTSLSFSSLNARHPCTSSMNRICSPPYVSFSPAVDTFGRRCEP